jgi:hypothetical protein
MTGMLPEEPLVLRQETGIDPRELAARQGNERPGASGTVRGLPDLTEGGRDARALAAGAPESEGVRVAREQRELNETKRRVSDAEADRLQADFDRRNAGVKIISKQEEAEAKKAALRGGGEISNVANGGGGEPPPERPRFARVGGKDIRAGFTRQIGVGRELLDETEESLADASIDKKLAAQGLSEKEAQRSERMSGALGRQIRREENAIREQEERNRLMNEDYARRQGEIDKERKAIESLEIKPDTLFDREDWAKVIGAIVSIVGSFAHGASGSKGPSPLDRLREAQDRSVDLQVRRRDMRRQNLVARETELERLEKHYGDPRLAEAELRDRQRALVQAYGEKMLVDAGATDAADKLRMKFAMWDEERAQGRLEREQQLGDKVVEQWQYQPERVVQVGGPKPLSEDARKRMVRINGRTGFVVDGSDRRPVQEAVSNLEHIGGQLNRLEQIVNDSSLSDIEKQRQIESLAGSLGPALSVAQGQGAMSDDERKRMESRLGDAQALLGSKERARTLINETKQFFGAKKDSIVRGSVYADPDAGQPFQGAPSRNRRYE